VPFDQRVLDALYPAASTEIARYYESEKTVKDSIRIVTFKKSMEFGRAFVEAGGLLGAGADPCCLSAIAGYGDQGNYERYDEAAANMVAARRSMRWGRADPPSSLALLEGGGSLRVVNSLRTAERVEPTRSHRICRGSRDRDSS
jgi:hypothetical protein